jgi:hypothetical protein
MITPKTLPFGGRDITIIGLTNTKAATNSTGMIKNKKEYKRDGEYAMSAVVVVLIISLLLMFLTPLNP